MCAAHVGRPHGKLMLILKGTTGKWQLIIDMMSFPKRSFWIGDVVKVIVELGKGTLLAKVDIKSAYRNVPVHSSDRWLMGMRWYKLIYSYSGRGRVDSPKGESCLSCTTWMTSVK